MTVSLVRGLAVVPVESLHGLVVHDRHGRPVFACKESASGATLFAGVEDPEGLRRLLDDLGVSAADPPVCLSHPTG